MRNIRTGGAHAHRKTGRLDGRKRLQRGLISPGANFYYLTGINIHEAGERLTVLAVNPDGEYHLLAPSLYQNVIGGDFPVTFWRDGENPYSKLETIMKELGIRGKVLIENTMRADWLIGIFHSRNSFDPPIRSAC